MERRQLRREVAVQMEAHILALDFDLGPEATAEDRAEAARQKAYVLEPLLKKLRRAQGHGKQTGKLISAGHVVEKTVQSIEGVLASA